MTLSLRKGSFNLSGIMISHDPNLTKLSTRKLNIEALKEQHH